MFVINKKQRIKNNKSISSIEIYEVSNFNFMTQNQIIKLLKKSKVIN